MASVTSSRISLCASDRMSSSAAIARFLSSAALSSFWPKTVTCRSRKPSGSPPVSCASMFQRSGVSSLRSVSSAASSIAASRSRKPVSSSIRSKYRSNSATARSPTCLWLVTTLFTRAWNFVNSGFAARVSNAWPTNSPMNRRPRPSMASFKLLKSESSCARWNTFRKFLALTPRAAPRNSSAVAGRSSWFLKPTFTPAATASSWARCRRTCTPPSPAAPDRRSRGSRTGQRRRP